jgi:uncharacterized protein with NAD-binding domain and iron-sulfur cluster
VSPGTARPIEVAVVGGGCASIAAAFELTRPEHAGRYRVSVYQQGWRLGGKGASGRGPADRIEEHGLHIWLGFYENAFRLLRECYAELGRDSAACRFARWEDVFFPDPITGVVDRAGSRAFAHWLAHFPPGAGAPGDPAAPPAFSVVDYMVRAVQLLRALLLSARGEAAAPGAAAEGAPPNAAALLEQVSRLLRYGQLATLTGLLQATQVLELALRAAPRLPTPPLLEFVDGVGRALRAQLDTLVESDPELRRVSEIVEIVLAILRGSLRFGLASHPDGFDAIDDWDWREWLRANGASERVLDSPFLHSLYDLAFAYEDGDRSRPRASAAAALRCAVRAFLTYRGSFFWKMRTGMGDAVFAPFYEVLRRRGVRFRFFHRLERVRLAPPERLGRDERPFVEALDFDVQAETRSGADYEPLVDVRGAPAWPARPDFSQLRDGERLRADGVDFESFWERRRTGQHTLRAARDFDFVVLGVGLGALPEIAGELLAREPRFERMVREVKTIATQAFQLWLREPVEALGWRGPPINLTGFPGAFETWADMRQLIPEESFPEAPGGIAYFCSSLHTPPGVPSRDETSHPLDQRKRVRDAAIHFLNHEITALWPQATRGGRFRFDLLVDAAGRSEREIGREDVARFETQFWTANVNPSDRYVLSVPGSARYRISPLDVGIDNLTVAGDWTACGLDVGCVEAAVMSGRLAAHAISGSPALEAITGYDHP